MIEKTDKKNLVLMITPKDGNIHLIPEILKSLARQFENDLKSGQLDDNCLACEFSADGGVEWDFVDTDIRGTADFVNSVTERGC